MKKIFRIYWIHLGLILCGAAVFTGCAQTEAQTLSARLQQDPLQLNVPVIQQSLGTSCGEAAIVIAYNYAHPQAPIREQEVIDYATSQDYFTVGTPPYTSPANMVKITHSSFTTTTRLPGLKNRPPGLVIRAFGTPGRTTVTPAAPDGG